MSSSIRRPRRFSSCSIPAGQTIAAQQWNSISGPRRPMRRWRKLFSAVERLAARPEAGAGSTWRDGSQPSRGAHRLTGRGTSRSERTRVGVAHTRDALRKRARVRRVAGRRVRTTRVARRVRRRAAGPLPHGRPPGGCRRRSRRRTGEHGRHARSSGAGDARLAATGRARHRGRVRAAGRHAWRSRLDTRPAPAHDRRLAHAIVWRRRSRCSNVSNTRAR